MLGPLPTEAHPTGDVRGSIFEGFTSGFDAGDINDFRCGISTEFSLNHTQDFMGQSFPLLLVLRAVGQGIAQGHGLQLGDRFCGVEQAVSAVSVRRRAEERRSISRIEQLNC